MPHPPENLARVLRDSLRSLLVAHGTLDDAQRPCGTPLSTPHAWALLELSSAGPMIVTTLAERLNIDRTNVSRLCARMELDGEVERVAHPQDQRARLIRLTDKGERLAAAVDQSSIDHFSSVLDRLDTGIVEIIETLNRLTQALSASDN